MLASLTDVVDVAGRVTGVEVGFQRKRVSPSGNRRRAGGDVDGQIEAFDPYSGGDILAVGGYIDTDNAAGKLGLFRRGWGGGAGGTTKV